MYNVPVPYANLDMAMSRHKISSVCCTVHTEYSNNPGLNLWFDSTRASPMSSCLESPGHGATAPFTSAYGKARTPYQSTSHNSYRTSCWDRKGFLRVGLCCIKVTRPLRWHRVIVTCSSDRVIRHCSTSLHPQANRVGKSGWQRRAAQLEPSSKRGET